MRIIFMSTSNFGSSILTKLIDSNHQIVGVYTKRNANNRISNILNIANKHNLKVFTPTTFSIEENVQQYRALKPDLVIVAAYGLILRENILNTPTHGCFGVHPSLLPRWRGAAPIERAIMNGDIKTGVCIMKMDEGIDTGSIIMKEEILINNRNYEEISLHLSHLGGNMILNILNDINNIIFSEQEGEGIYAEKITLEDCKINWQNSAHMIDCQIRALNAKKGAYFIHNKQMIKIFEASTKQYTHDADAASVGMVLNEHLDIYCGHNTILSPTIIQRSNYTKLKVKEFLLGYKINKYEVLQ